MKTVNANGISLGYDRFGDPGAEVVLLISGLGTQRIRWTAPFCRILAARGYHVLRYDNRDAGSSTHFSHCAVPDFAALAEAAAAGRPPRVPYTLHDMAKDAIGLLDALSVARAHVVGRSMGGMIGQLLASDWPERVLSLSSVMSSTGNPGLPRAAPDVMALLTQPRPDPVADQRGFLDHSLAFARCIAGSGFAFDAGASRAMILAELACAHDPAGFGRQIAAIAATGDLRPRLAGIVAPTLVIHGADDPLIPPACGEDTAASIPDAEFMRIDGMGHDLPAALYQTIADAIARNAARASTGSRCAEPAR